MDEQRKRGRAASRFGADMRGGAQLEGRTEFTGYEHDRSEANVVALLKGNEPVAELAAGEEGQVVLDATPFYAESGGQVGDIGVLQGTNARFRVADTQKLGRAYSHLGRVEQGSLKVGDLVEAIIDAERRNATRLNHSATHLLHAALRKVLGTHVTQKGSLVAPDRLRFDFSHYAPLTPEELREIERQVNAEIRANAPVETRVMKFDDAVASGAMALFGEKYDEDVRVLRLGDYSTELCGGTHVARAGDIGLFRILSEGGIASGVRRIEAVTGQGALDHVVATDQLLRDVAGLVRGSRDDLQEKVRQLVDRGRRLEKEISQLKSKLASGQGRDLAEGAKTIGGINVVATSVDGADAGALRTAVDQLKSRLKSAAIVLGSVDADGKVTLIAGVTPDATARVKAGELVNYVAQQVGGKGGGRPDLAQAGGNQPQNLASALESVAAWIAGKLS
jgi:alanyl-tRNA synthetase